MKDWEFDEFGTKIQDIIDQAVNSRNYQKLNQSINQTINKAIENGGDVIKNAINGTAAEGRKRAEEFQKNMHYGRQQMQNSYQTQKASMPPAIPEHLYAKPTNIQLKGILCTIGGSIGLLGTLPGFIMFILSCMIGLYVPVYGSILLAMLTVITGGCLGVGIRCLRFVSRFKKYRKVLGTRTYCDLEQLRQITGKDLKFIRKDIKKMLKKGLFTEGHLDQQEKCLIISHETYQQYLETQKQLEERNREKDPKVDTSGTLSSEVQEILDKGNQFLVKIRESNDAIPGYEISAKISHMEKLVQKIFERAKEHPEIIPDLNKLMNYYLPVTIKLLDAYEDMDGQPIQGENIKTAKKEIEDTLDTLNIAFEKLLDSIFKDIAWDVSSDISVLHTVLAQEGLTEDSITGRKRQ